MMVANANSSDNKRIKEDISSATDKITGFISNKIDDAKYQLEARQRKFDISGPGSDLDRTRAGINRWFKNEKEEVKEGIENLATNLGISKQKDEDPDGQAGCGSCAGGCGLFST